MTTKGGNLAGAKITKLPENMDPATAHAVLEQAEAFAFHIRDLIERGHKPRHAIEIALKNAGVYEILTKREGAMDRLVAYFEREVERLTAALDDKATIGIKRGVVVNKGKLKADRNAVILGADGQPMKKASGQ